MDIDLAFQSADDLFRTSVPPDAEVPAPLLSTVWDAPGVENTSASVWKGAAALGKGASDAASDAAHGIGDWFSSLVSKLKWGIVLLPVVLLVGLYLVMRIMNAANAASGPRT